MTFQLPTDLSNGLTGEQITALRSALPDLTDQQLADAHTALTAALGTVATGTPTAGAVNAATSLADALDAVTAAQHQRATALAAVPPAAPDGAPDPVEPPPDPATVTALAVVALADAAAALAAAVSPAPEDGAGARPAGGARTALRELGGLAGPRQYLNPQLRGAGPARMSIGDIARFAPMPQVPAREDPVLVAAGDLVGLPKGARIDNFTDLVVAMRTRAQSVGISRMPYGQEHMAPRYPVATLSRSFAHTLGLDATPEQFNAVMTAATDPAVLTAAGGWCAPSEISYDFYNIVCMDGTVDIPTVGMNRGGMRWPTSANFASLSALSGIAWTWNETMDIAAATGTGQSGTKPCVRVPCPSMNEVREACDGMCVTVGNLTEAAWPELVANHLRLVEAIHYHYVNARIIAAMEAGSTAVDTTETGTPPAAPAILNALTFERRDLIEKYSMCDNAVMQSVHPRYHRDLIRNDLAYRTGVENMMCVTDAMIADWLDCRNISAQFVADWQVRGTGQPGAASAPGIWPTSSKFMLFPAGTFIRALGPTINLGVVRDSTMNATNDHTAAWMEECWALAMVGHESRVATVTHGVTGQTGAANIGAAIAGVEL